MVILIALGSVDHLVAQNDSVGCKPQTIEIPVEGFTALRLKEVTLCRYSDAAGRWIAEFRAGREVTKGQFISWLWTRQESYSDYQYYVITKGRYESEQIDSFSITADTSWAAQESAVKEETKLAAIRAVKLKKEKAERDARVAKQKAEYQNQRDEIELRRRA